MTTTTWENTAGGDFNNAADWSAGVPGSGDTALITAKGTYTVADSGEFDQVNILEMSKSATLSIISTSSDVTPNQFWLTSGSGTGSLAGTINVTGSSVLYLVPSSAGATLNNTGTIEVSEVAALQITGAATFTGKGDINLADQAVIFGAGSATLNNGNTISGAGSIYNVSLTNTAKGVVNANSSGETLAVSGASLSNSGLMEASGSGELDIDSDVTQGTTGRIEAASVGATVKLDGVKINGGKISTAKNGILLAVNDPSFIDTPNTTINAGLIESEAGAVLNFGGSVKNAGLLYAAGGGILIGGSSIGGAATIGDGDLEFGGPATTNVTFATNATGYLLLADATKFTGTVAGTSSAPNALIDLPNIKFADNPTVVYSLPKHLLTVTDPITHTTDKIKIAGAAGTFTKSAAGDGSTLISDPPAAASAPQVNIALLAQTMAAFGRASGGDGSSDTSAADDHRSPELLAAPHHG